MNKQEFYSSLTPSTEPCEELFKKIYGYSYYDADFLQSVAVRLTILGKKDIAQQYNEWFAGWNAQHEAELRSAAQWYRKQVEQDAENKRRKEAREWERNIREMSNSELLTYLESLSAGDSLPSKTE